MIFQDIFNEKSDVLHPVFGCFLHLCEKNQTDIGDLFLVRENGFYDPDVNMNDDSSVKFSPYILGHGVEGNSELNNHEFMGKYINTNLTHQLFKNYLDSIKYDANRLLQIHQLESDETYSIQHEMLIYLKIWESDAFIKRLYQLARIANGEAYNWHFKIKKKPGDKNATGIRSEIISKLIRDRFEARLPELYNAINIAYNSQIRNAIAHSQYVPVGRSIQLNNYRKNDKYNSLRSISYDRWIDMFHESITIYCWYVRVLNDLGEHYDNIAKMNNNRFRIRINRKDPIEGVQYCVIVYNPDLRIWSWEQS
jgi:hypothetical protein